MGKYYERPSWLEKPIYEVLQQEGRFTKYLQCVDKTEYALVLKGAGLYTVFAPNDSAFTAYLNKKSYASVDDIPVEELKNLAAYSIVYSKWTGEHLGDYLDKRLYVTGAFKRKTNCYALPYKDSEFDDNWVFNQTTEGGVTTFSTNYQYRLSENNYKYLPVFTEAYFKSFPAPLGATDYNTFFPNSTYTGKNVQDGTILTEDIIAENGVIHEVSSVNEPLKNMDEILREPTYSEFKSLLEFKDNNGQTIFRKYTEAPANLLDMYRKLSPGESIEKIYHKSYSLLSFSPILENILSDASGTYETERTGNTLFVPKNEALQAYLQNRLLKYYTSIDQLPDEVISTLINTQMVRGLVWPSQYQGSMTSTGEYVNGQGTYGKTFENAGITDKKMASNGFVYMTDDVIKSRYFETVYSEIFLNPTHAWLNQAYVNFYGTGLREDLMKSILNGYPSERYTILNFSDALLRADGYTLNSTVSPPSFVNSEVSPSALTEERIKRLMRMHIFPGLNNNEVNSEVTGFTTAPIPNYGGWGFLVNAYGDLVRYKNNQLQAAGNIEDGTFVTVTKVNDTYNNGSVYNVDKMLQYSPRATAIGEARWKELTLWQYLLRAKTQHPGVSKFVDYVQACLKNPDTDDLDGIKTENFYTVLMVNNSAIDQAVARGFLPALTIIQGGDLAARAKATQFLNAHFLQGTVLPDDGLKFIYPVNPMSPTRILAPTILKITDERLGLTSVTTRIEVKKETTGLITFTPQNITLGTQILDTAAFGLSSVMRVQRGIVTGTTIPNNFRSNRIACKAVLHEVNNFFIFKLKRN
ncbi:MAG TPA: fasciclin domain-containing protein [Bacteroidales bacterium]|nr:fasciclin domain-containing protein [Bacteroidales bacterium]